MKRKLVIMVAMAMIVSLAFGMGSASAHVVVYPREATQGNYEKFTVRVPTEKEVPTTKVEVAIPAGVNISRFEPKPDWMYEIVKDATGKIERVIWTATGAGLSATEFGDFNMQGKVADDAVELVWKAYQTYYDGEVVEWTGAPGADKPASVTTVKANPAGGAGHDHGAVAEADANADGDRTALYLAIIAVVLGACALIISLIGMRRSRS